MAGDNFVIGVEILEQILSALLLLMQQMAKK
jgi:hypothetical protein